MEEHRFPRAVTSLNALFTFIDGFAGRHGVDAQAASELRLALEELFVNMVKYHPEGREPILIRLDRDGDRIRVLLQDFGVDAWDVTAAPPADTTVPLESRNPGGLGMHLVRRVTDDLRYEYRDRCSTITLTKRVGP